MAITTKQIIDTIINIAHVTIVEDQVIVKVDGTMNDFKQQVVTALTERKNSKRGGDSRFDYLMDQFVKGLRDGSKYKTFKLYLLCNEHEKIQLRNRKGHFIPQNQIFVDQFGSVWNKVNGLMTRVVIAGDHAKRGRKAKVQTPEVAEVQAEA